jgi:enoyl-CoA hydratase
VQTWRAQWGQPEIDLGIIPGWGGTQRLPRLVGKSMAKYLIFSGERLSAQEAQRIGLVDFVVPHAELMERAKALARKLSEKPRIAMTLAKKAIEEGMPVDLERGCTIEAAYFGLTCATQDRIEGVSAFLEKRRPQFVDG